MVLRYLSSVNGTGVVTAAGELVTWGALEGAAIKFMGDNAGKGKYDTKWHRMTSKESGSAAKKLGFEKTNYRTKNGEAVYYNKKTKTYISQDIGSGDGSGSHNGGVWKQAKTPEGLNSKSTRMGTYDINLNRIGD